MTGAKYIQSPSERKRYALDYSCWLEDDEVLTNATFVITPSDVPAFEVDAHSVSADGKSIVFYTSGGVDGTKYKLEVFAVTSYGQTKEDVVMFTLRDP